MLFRNEMIKVVTNNSYHICDNMFLEIHNEILNSDTNFLLLSEIEKSFNSEIIVTKLFNINSIVRIEPYKETDNF